MLDATRLAYCQPYVGAIFNFLLADEARLAGWQSGALWADLTPKPSDAAFAQAIGEANAGAIDCDALKGGRPSSDFMPPNRALGPDGQRRARPAARRPGLAGLDRRRRLGLLPDHAQRQPLRNHRRHQLKRHGGGRDDRLLLCGQGGRRGRQPQRSCRPRNCHDARRDAAHRPIRIDRGAASRPGARGPDLVSQQR